MENSGSFIHSLSFIHLHLRSTKKGFNGFADFQNIIYDQTDFLEDVDMDVDDDDDDENRMICNANKN